MISVLLDSSNNALSVGIARDNELVESVSYVAWQEQSEHMIPELDMLLKKHKVNKDEINEIIVSIGPGSYTGVRIALTIAKVLALACNATIYPVSSLRVLMNFGSPSICLINARSNRSYIGVYFNDQIILADQIMTNDLVMDYINKHPNYFVMGDVQYLGLENCESNISKNMTLLRPYLLKIDNPLSLTPIYMKG